MKKFLETGISYTQLQNSILPTENLIQKVSLQYSSSVWLSEYLKSEEHSCVEAGLELPN